MNRRYWFEKIHVTDSVGLFLETKDISKTKDTYNNLTMDRRRSLQIIFANYTYLNTCVVQSPFCCTENDKTCFSL